MTPLPDFRARLPGGRRARVAWATAETAPSRGNGFISGGTVGAVSLGLGGTVMAFAGLPGVTTGVVAAPVLATAIQTLFLKIGDAVPRPSLPLLPFQTPGEMTEPASPSS
ncbi:MAG: hypothetical protein WCJ64_16420 [Rhodospirillaceae bacterium]